MTETRPIGPDEWLESALHRLSGFTDDDARHAAVLRLKIELVQMAREAIARERERWLAQLGELDKALAPAPEMARKAN